MCPVLLGQNVQKRSSFWDRLAVPKLGGDVATRCVSGTTMGDREKAFLVTRDRGLPRRSRVEGTTNGSAKTKKCDPKTVPKLGPFLDPVFAFFREPRPHFGRPRFGVQLRAPCSKQGAKTFNKDQSNFPSRHPIVCFWDRRAVLISGPLYYPEVVSETKSPSIAENR